MDEHSQVWIGVRKILLWVKEREKGGGGGEEKGKENGAGISSLRCGCSPGFSSLLNI